jgi:TonB-linked SusC/RagA family outer membrane protein
MQLADRGPLFYRSIGDAAVPLDVRNELMLQRHIALDLEDVPLTVAIDAAAQAAGISIIYSHADLVLTRRVTLQATKITLAGALTAILVDAGLNVYVSPLGTLTLARRSTEVKEAAHQARIDSVIVNGIVTDATTHAPLAGAIIRVAGSRQVAITSGDGKYEIQGLAKGRYSLTVRRLGYSIATVELVALDAGGYVTNIALTAVPTVLDKVVTTVTGNQKLSAIGNTIATINADSLVPTTPVTTLSDVINARAPGVQVINPGGLTGASPYIYMRGPGSLTLSMQPLLYIDGVRVANSTASVSGYETASGRFNDLVPDEIESIEIVKGPSAATLYGTDAANGVILVTTKHGVIGAPRWNIYAEGGALTIDPDQFGFNYTGWGHAPGGAETNSCTLLDVAAGSCTQDSITKFNPLRVPSLTPLGTGNRAEVGAQVSGGDKNVRYFVSGDYTSEVGYLKDDSYDQRILDSLVGPTAGAGNVRHPNAVSKYDGRINLTAPLGHNGDISLTASYLSQNSSIPYAGSIEYWGGGVGYRDPAADWLFGANPASWFGSIESESNQHFTGALTAHWLPTHWLTARATAGLDASTEGFSQLIPAASAPVTEVPGGNVIDTRGTTNLYSLDVGATARLPLVSRLVSSTSIGAQYHRAVTETATASATDLTTGAVSVSGGLPSGAEVDSEGVVAGVYAEEQLAFNDRLFLTGAVRVDGANDFGSDFQSATYPKGSISWLISREPFFPTLSWLSLLRLRSAYGESGTQPGEVLTTLTTAPVTIDGVLQPGTTLQTLANPRIQPERQKELEIGADLDLADNRIHAEFTYYSKRNVNALYNVPLGSSLGNVGSIEENVGTIVNWGYEALLSAALIASKAVTWDVSFNGSINHNQVVTLGPYFQPIYGEYGSTSIVAGYPIYSMFANPYTFSDPNGNGILEPGELTVQNRQQYYGPTIPPIQLTAATHIALFDGRIRIGALFDYRGGFVLVNDVLLNQCVNGTARASVNRNASLSDQAVCLAYSGNYNYDPRGLFSDGAFLRFRELSVTYTAPDALAHHMSARSLSLTLSARNVALWSHFNGGDPETAPSGLGTAGTYFGGGGLPPAQYWLARVNIGL